MKYLTKIFLISFQILVALTLQAQDIPSPMNPPRLVNDFANIFSTQESLNLERTLRDYNDSTSTQIYIITVKNLGGYASSEYAFKIGQEWGIGQKSKDNGAVILIKPKMGNSRGDVFIAVGYGLEEKLNDARIGRIIDNYMLPYFRSENYYGGAKAASLRMMQYLSGQFQADEEETTSTKDLIISLILIFIFIYFMQKVGGGSRNNHRRRGGGFFPPMTGGGFGSRGGGFSGGGGGSFGGGGAGRSW